jgi:hypothetical protein
MLGNVSKHLPNNPVKIFVCYWISGYLVTIRNEKVKGSTPLGSIMFITKGLAFHRGQLTTETYNTSKVVQGCSRLPKAVTAHGLDARWQQAGAAARQGRVRVYIAAGCY